MTPPFDISFVLPGAGVSGGIRVTVELANELLTRGYRVRILCRRRRSLRERLRRRLRQSNGGHADFLDAFDGVRHDYARIEDVAFHAGEVVVGVGTMVFDDLAAIACPVRKLRFCHGLGEYSGEELRRVWCGPAATIAVSPGLVAELRSLGAENVLGVVPNAISRETYQVQGGTVRDTVGGVYYDHPAKAPEDMLSVMATLKSERPDQAICCFGLPKRPSGWEGVEYHQLPDLEKARGIYNRALVWVSTSRREGFGLPVLEAMACGCAVVSTENQGSRMLIEQERNGLLVPAGDREALLAAVCRVLDDPSLREQLVEGGLETVQQFSWAASADAFEEVLKKLQSPREEESIA